MTHQSRQLLDQTIMRLIDEKKPQDIKQLVELTRQQISVSEKEALEEIIKLENEGKLSFFKSESKILSLAMYAKSEHAVWFWINLIIALATVPAVFLIPENLYPWLYIRIVFGAIYVLWLPGSSLVRALFPPKQQKRDQPEKDMDATEKMALSIGISLALVPLVGLLLNYTPWGITLVPIIISLLMLTLIFSVAALAREYQIQKM